MPHREPAKPERRSRRRPKAPSRRSAVLLLRTGIEPFNGDALDLLAWTYRNPEIPAYLRVEAAKAAIGYERPRLAVVKTIEGTHEREYADLDPEGRAKWAQDVIDEAKRLLARSRARPPMINGEAHEVEAEAEAVGSTADIM